MTTNSPNQYASRLTQISLAVKPEGLIADVVCPRVPVPAEKFDYTVFAEDQFFNIPDTRVGRKSQAQEVEFGGSLVTASTYDYALEDFVPQKDMDNAKSGQGNYDPMGLATEGTTTLIAMAREQRVATMFQAQANFATGLKQTLSGTSQWSDGANSDPIKDIKTAQDTMLVAPNVMIIGRAVATALSMHPKIVAAIYGKVGVGAASSAAGVVEMAALADLLGLKAVYVGDTFYNSAKPGQAANFSRLWGKHSTLARIDTNVRSINGGATPTFALTAEWQGRRATTYQSPERGISGGTTIKVAEQINELILWQKAGYLFTNAVA